MDRVCIYSACTNNSVYSGFRRWRHVAVFTDDVIAKSASCDTRLFFVVLVFALVLLVLLLLLPQRASFSALYLLLHRCFLPRPLLRACALSVSFTAPRNT